MTWYAQRGEDAKLVEILTTLGFPPEGRNGFYIDIGAWEPTVDSVTKWFYDRGWFGINVEPVPYYHNLLQADRVLDVNVRFAISDRIGQAEMVCYEGSGLSTLTEEYKNQPYSFSRSTVRVPTITLAALCNMYVPCMNNGFSWEIDFLKIDVEGHEREVLIGGDWTHYRPRVMVIEATKPGTDIPAWDLWDGFVRNECAYDFLEFDGLNRWYVDRRLNR